ncbi:MAG: aspartate 1-decarboxylase [Proteobacteria bacterium]|nr:aspartate 1-decarboxylase [Pseudomonadota bacterium]
MQRQMLKSKIHRASVTDANVDYEGSITLDLDLMEAADLVEYEQVEVWDITNGARLTTYAIPGERGSGIVAINGAAAHLVTTGDRVIVGSFARYDESELTGFTARKVFVDGKNRISRIVFSGAGEQPASPADAGSGAEMC